MSEAAAASPSIWRRLAGVVTSGVIDNVLPSSCIACAAPVAVQGGLCGACFRGITFVAAPFCGACGVPLPHGAAAGADEVCAACLAVPHAFGRARAALVYDEGAKPLILGYKHFDRTHNAAALAGMMARAGSDLLADATLLVPVPLHWRRLLSRRYNQSALLAAGLARLAGLPHIPDLLVRIRATPSLGDKGAAERAAVLKDAFRLTARHRHRVALQRVLLVDDVLTSGATASECARMLKAAGAAAVDVLAVARVPAPWRQG